MSPPTNQILIIGAGISGLVLAQGLKHRNIPFRIYERDPQILTKGYRFRVVDDGLDALEKTLPPALWKLIEDTHPASSPPRLLMLDAVSGEKMALRPTTDTRSYPVDRHWIRELLIIGIEEHVVFNKSFERYELGDGGVNVHFTDGSTVTGRMVIGADGAHSRVRRQFLPESRLLDLERTIIWGRTPLTPEFEKRFNRPDVLAEHFACMVDPNDNRHSLFFAPLRWSGNGKLSRVSEKLKDQEDYMFLALNFETPVGKLDTKEAREEHARKISQGWDADLCNLLTMMDESSAIRVHSSRPDVEVWETDDRVTLLGDAIHLMSPSGGSGGLTAIQDAAELTTVLSEFWVDGKWVDLKPGMARYEGNMRERAKKAIDVSFAGGKFLWAGKDWNEYLEVENS